MFEWLDLEHSRAPTHAGGGQEAAVAFLKEPIKGIAAWNLAYAEHFKRVHMLDLDAKHGFHFFQVLVGFRKLRSRVAEHVLRGNLWVLLLQMDC